MKGNIQKEDKKYLRKISGIDIVRVMHFAVALIIVVEFKDSRWWLFLCVLLNLLYAWNNLLHHLKNILNMKEKEMQGFFAGANLINPQIVFAECGAKVVYKEVVASKDKKPQVTDEQVANAIRAINGKNKPLDNYQRWLGACCLLSWKYDYPRNIGECCQRINSLGMNDLEFECKYENIRKLTATNRFVKEDVRLWDSYKPRENERKLFNECLSVAQALDAEIVKQIKGE